MKKQQLISAWEQGLLSDKGKDKLIQVLLFGEKNYQESRDKITDKGLGVPPRIYPEGRGGKQIDAIDGEDLGGTYTQTQASKKEGDE